MSILVKPKLKKEKKNIPITDFFVPKLLVPLSPSSPPIELSISLKPPSKDNNETTTSSEGPAKKVQTYLANKNRHPRDAFISFKEENHEYTVMGEKGYTSVTTFVHKHFPHFDNESIINNILSSKRINTDPTYKYYEMTKEQILADWETNRNSAAEAGTKLHYDIEAYFNLDPQ